MESKSIDSMKIVILVLTLLSTLSANCTSNQNVDSQPSQKVESPEEYVSKEPIDSSCLKCNGQYVRYIKLNIDNLDTISIENFLCTIEKSCKNNVEFSQFSNKVLFLLLLNYCDLTVELLSTNEYQIEYICEMLSHPIHDGLDVDGVAERLKERDDHKVVRMKLLHSLPGHSSEK